MEKRKGIRHLQKARNTLKEKLGDAFGEITEQAPGSRISADLTPDESTVLEDLRRDRLQYRRSKIYQRPKKGKGPVKPKKIVFTEQETATLKNLMRRAADEGKTWHDVLYGNVYLGPPPVDEFEKIVLYKAKTQFWKRT